MCNTKYRIIKDKEGIKQYNHHDEWKKVFQPKEKRDYLTIGDIPEMNQLMEKCTCETGKKNSKRTKCNSCSCKRCV